VNRDHVHALFDLTGRTAIITGASRGIGKEVATTFAAMGANVVVSSRKAEACTATASEITATGGNAVPVAAHAGDPDALQILVDRTVAEFGGIDIVVNNAANALTQPIGSITADAWDKSHAVNVRGPLMLVQSAMPHLIESPNASVVNMISAGVYTQAGFMAIYIAAKSALASLTRSMAAELVQYGIRVNALAPGTIDTDMVRNNPQEMQDLMIGASLMGRIGTPSEVAVAALFMTGQELVIDGGMTTH
jgi:NAD(P)-dependent dehydrogenase (short-subunit alcohol dehydrogenase family)